MEVGRFNEHIRLQIAMCVCVGGGGGGGGGEDENGAKKRLPVGGKLVNPTAATFTATETKPGFPSLFGQEKRKRNCSVDLLLFGPLPTHSGPFASTFFCLCTSLSTGQFRSLYPGKVWEPVWPSSKALGW